jgi:glucans biosynthesis protein
MNEIVAGEARHLPYDSADFDFGKNTLSPETWGELDYAGLRVHYHLNGPQYKDELIVFLGASYFRALAAGTRYGLSARGLAVDTVGGQGEEFPYFPEFWIEKPAADAQTLRMFALLDSPRVAGAYQFDVTPGDETVVEVRTRLYLREPIATLGIAPLTSMYQFGENQPHRVDFRPEVHDSDGLMVATGDGEWLWRPLINPNQVLTTSFSMRELKGFGLLQRDRSFTSYEDTEARYELRPSAWIEPVGSWGPGRVELVQLHTPNETNDNIVAYWVPSAQITPQNPMNFSYDLLWTTEDPRTKEKQQAGRVESTRVDSRLEAEHTKDTVRFTIDFESTELAKLPADTVLRGVVATMGGDEGYGIVEQQVLKIPATNGWRLVFRVPKARRPIELRAYLDQGGKPLTETWTYTLEP